MGKNSKPKKTKKRKLKKEKVDAIKRKEALIREPPCSDGWC
jgi:hypothetical protein